ACVDHTAVDGNFENLRKWRPRMGNIAKLGIELPISTVAQDEPIVGIEQYEAIRNRFDGCLNHAALLLTKRRQFCAFDDAVAKQPESASHRADFVRRRCGDWRIKIAA